MKSRIFIFLHAAICIWVLLNNFNNRHPETYSWDKCGYHLYLPAVFIHQDLGNLTFYPEVLKKYRFCGDLYWYGTTEQPTGRRLNKYPPGVAVLETPFFLAAQAYANNTNKPEADGFSIPYRMASSLSNIFWCLVGLFFLRALLRRYFSDTVTVISLVCIALGTNLYFQTAWDGGSHVYGFCMVAGALNFADKWYKTAKPGALYMLALALGFIVIIRPVDIVMMPAILFWKVHNLETLKQRFSFWLNNIPKIAVALLFFFMVASIQLAYWKYTTGHWVVYSYTGERFDFLNPHVGKGLFGFRKGWFVYTPMAALGCLGFIFLWKRYRVLVPVLLVTLLLVSYVVFSWTNWWYGGSFSARAMTDFISLIALPLAAFIQYLLSRPVAGKVLSCILLLAIIGLNLLQSYQFSKNIIHYDRMTRAYYWRVFSYMDIGQVTEEDLKYLMSDSEYWKATSEAYD